MKITLVRHGQTESNYQNICQGSTNGLLNETGKRQARRLREKVKDIKYDICYTSPLARCVETAMVMIGDRVAMNLDSRLKDRDMGEFEGKDRSLYDSYLYWDYKLNCDDKKVEPVQAIFKRCREFLDCIYDDDASKNVLIVAHAASIRAIRHIIMNTDLDNEDLLKDGIDNCYYEEIEYVRTKKETK